MATNRINYFRKYVKNVGKSFGYAAVDILKEYNPIVTDVFSSTKGAVSSTYNQIKDFAFSSHSESEKSLLGEIKDSTKGALGNLLDDLKTGNWYNKARDEAADEDLMKALGFDMSDFDFDFNFDDESWGEGDDSFTASAKSEMQEDKKNTAATIASMNIVGNRVASAVNEGTVRSANYISNTIRESNKAIYDLNQRGFSQTLLGINAVNGTIAEFANKIGTPLTAHMQNATVFYTKTTEQLTKIEQHLATIVQNTTTRVAGEGRYRGTKKPGMEDMLTSSGLDINRYFDFVKGSLSEYKDTADMILNFAKGSLGIGTGKSNLSLGKSLLTGGLKAMIPQFFKDSMETFNKALGDFLAGALVKASRSSPSNLALDILKDIFVPSNYFKKGIDTSSYEKGAVAWDGKARKALVEVIPTTLFKILAALTGKEQRYDYSTGKFIDVKSIKESQEEMLKSNAKKAGGDYRAKARELARVKAKGNKILEEQYLDEIENYFYNAYADDYGYKNFDKIGKSDFKREKFGIKSDEVIKILRAVVASGKADSYFRNNASMRAQQRRELLEAERSGDHIFTALANGSYDFGAIKAGKTGAKLGFFNKGSLGYYIKGIYEHTGYIATNLSKLGSGVPTGGQGSTAEFSKFGEFDPGKVRRVLKLANETQRQTLSSQIDNSDKGINKLKGEIHTDEANDKIKTIDDFASEDEYNEYLRNRKGKETKDKLTEAQKSIKEKISKMFKGLPRGLKNIFDGPFNAAAKLLDTISSGFSTFLWGDPTGTDKGFFGTMKDKLSDTFKSVTDSLKDETKNWFKRAFEAIFGTKGEDGKRHGGFFGTGFGTEVKAELGKAGEWLSDTGREILYGTKYAEAYRNNRNAQNANADNGTAARGRRVTRSGIVSVSEGEMIIPSDFNPNYHGSNDKNSQIRNELRNRDRFFSGKGGLGATEYWGNYAEGTTNPMLYDGIQRKAGDIITKYDKNGNPRYYRLDKNGKLKRVKNEDYKNFTATSRNRLDESGNLTRNVGDQNIEVGGFVGALFGAQKLGAEIVGDVKERLFDDDGTDASKKAARERDKQAILAGLSTLGGEAKKNRGALGAGAIIGAGASLLTGGVVGPLLGASIGAATGLTIRSATVQKFLFGDEDHEGIFKKEFGEKVKKYAPSMAKGGVAGAIGGLFLGSPVMGAVVGSSIGYVSKSEKAQEILFGTPDDPKLLGKVKDKIKERIPGMTIGAIGGLLVGGPFGIAGNMILGSGIGYLATSEKAKEFFLGKKGENGKRVGGFLYDIKNKVFSNISELFHNLMNSTKGFGKKLLRSVTRHSKNLMSSITKKIAGAMAKTRGGSKILNFVKNVPGNIVDAAGRVTGVFSRRRQKKNLGKGYDVYDKRLGRNMTAMERIALRNERGYNTNNTMTRFDEMLANVKSEEDLDRINSTIDTLINPEKTSKQMRNQSATMLYNGLSDSVDAKKIVKAMQSGDLEVAKKMIKDQGGTEHDLELLKNARKTYEDADKQQSNAKDTLRHWAQAYGIDFTGNPDQLANIQDLIKTERERFKGEKDKEENQPGTFKYRVIHALESIAENVYKQTKEEGIEDANAPEGVKSEKEKRDETRKFEDFVKVTEGRYDPRKFQDQINDIADNNPIDNEYTRARQEILDQYENGLGQYEGGFNRFRRNLNKNAKLAGLGFKATMSKVGRDLKTDATSIGIGAKKAGGALASGAVGLGKGAWKVGTSPFRFIGRRYKGFKDAMSQAIENSHVREEGMLEYAKQKVAEGRGGEVVWYKNAWRNYEDIAAGIDRKIEKRNEREQAREEEELDPALAAAQYGFTEADGFDERNPLYAYGTPFARRGLASVSRGELILPPYYGNYAGGGVANGLMPMLTMLYGLGMKGVGLGRKALGGAISAAKGVSDFYRKNFGTGGLNDNEFIDTFGNPSKVNASDDDAQKAFVSHVDFMGGVHQYEKNAQGEITEVTNDRETDAARSKMNNLYDAITGSAKLSAAQFGLMGAGYGLSAEELKKLGLGGGESGNGSGSGLFSGTLGNIIASVAKVGVLGTATKLIKSGINKFLYGQSNVKGLTKSEKAEQLLTKHNVFGLREAYLKNKFGNIDIDNVYGHGTYDSMFGDDAIKGLDSLDDTALSKYNLAWDDGLKQYVDLTNGETFDGGYIDKEGNIRNYETDDIIREANKADDAKSVISKNADDVNNTINKADDAKSAINKSGKTKPGSDKSFDKIDDIDDAKSTINKPKTSTTTTNTATETVKNFTPTVSASENLAIHNYQLKTGGKYDTFQHIDDIDSELGNYYKISTGNTGTIASHMDDVIKVGGDAAKASKLARLTNKLTSTKAGSALVAAAGKVKALGKKIFSFLKSNLLSIIIAIALCIGAILGVLYDHYYYMNDTEISEFINGQLVETANKGYNNYFESVDDFKEYVNKYDNVAKWFEEHPCGAAIWIKGSKDPESKDCTTVFPYMVYAPAAHTLFTKEIYKKARLRGDYDKNIYTGKSIYQASSEDTTKYFGLFNERLVSYNLFMVENFKYFRTYTVGPGGDIASRIGYVVNDNLSGKLGIAVVNSVGNTLVEAVTLGHISGGDLTEKKYTYTNYEYTAKKYETKAGSGIINFNDSFFSPLKLEKPDIVDYANSQTDWAVGIYNGNYSESGSNTVINTDASDLSDNVDTKQLFQNRQDALLSYIQNHYKDYSAPQLMDVDGLPLEGDKVLSATYEKDYGWIEELYNKYISGSGSGLRRRKYGSGAGAFVSQYNNKYKNISYGKSNIGDIGCAPAAASNLVSALGGHLSMKDAISAGKRYTNENGTDIRYFDEVLGRSGYKPNMLNTASDITNSLANNNPVVMLGKDESNNDKDVSSFGPRSHYVVGTGLNPDGTVNVLDSENNAPKAYNLKKILDGTYAAMNASGGATGLGFADKTKRDLDRKLGKVGTTTTSGDTTKKDDTKKTTNNAASITRSYAAEQAEAEGKARDAAKKSTTTSGGDNTTSSGNNTSSSGSTDDYSTTSDYSSTIETVQQTYDNSINGILSYLSDKIATAFGFSPKNGPMLTASDIVSHDFKYKNSKLNNAIIEGMSDEELKEELKKYAEAQKGTTEQKLQAMIDYAKEHQYTDVYTQNSSLRETTGYSDCSSWANRMYKKYIGSPIGGYTVGIFDNAENNNNNLRFLDLRTSGDGDYNALGDENRKPGDIILFRSKNYANNSLGLSDEEKKTPTHKNRYNLSHVELYAGDHKLIGQTNQNSNGGPSLHGWSYFNRENSDGSTYNRYLATIRYMDGEIKDTTTGKSTTADSGRTYASESAKHEGWNRTIEESKKKTAKDMTKDQVKNTVWAYFKANGYTDEATAGIMGNIQQESDFNPTDVTVEPNKAKNWAAGLFQWHDKRSYDNGNYTYVNKNGKTVTQTPERFGQLSKLAKEKGLDWTNPALQMEFAESELMNLNPRWMNLNYQTKDSDLATASENNFKKRNLTAADSVNPSDFKYITNVDKAAMIFDAGFERSDGSESGNANRKKYAKEIYKKYAGSGSGIDEGFKEINTQDSRKAGDIINSVSGDVNKLYYKEKETAANKKQFDMIKKAISMNNTEQYSMSDKRGKSSGGFFYSDCSNFVQRMYQDAFGVDVGSYTAEQASRIMEGKVPGVKMMVWDPNGNRYPYLGQLRVGDIMFFKTKGYKPERKAGGLSHVELYAGDGYIIGQDALGPNLDGKEMTTDGKALQGSGPTYRSLESTRPEGYKEMFSDAVYKDGKRYEGQPLYDRFLGFARYVGEDKDNVGGRSGLLSYKKNLNEPDQLYKTDHRSKRRSNLYSRGASEMLDQDYMVRDTKKILDNLQTAVVAKGKSGEISQDIVAQMIMAIIEILKAIAANTMPVGDIYSKLSTFNTNLLSIGGSGSNASTAVTRNDTKKQSKYHQNGRYIGKSSYEPSAALKTLVNGLASFAKG